MSVTVLAALPSVSESRIKRITRIARITHHRLTAGPIPPAPVIRFAHCRLRLCLRGKGERMAFLKVCIQGCFDGFGRLDHAMKKRPIPPAPFPARKGGAHGFLERLYPGLF